MFHIFIITILLAFGAFAHGCDNCNCQKSQKVLWYASYEECEGKDSANYTLLSEDKLSENCERLLDVNSQLVTCSSNGARGVDRLQTLAVSQYPAGAYQQYEALYLAIGGPLDGKYVYEKAIFLSAAYLKKCSSVLGYSYVSTKSAVLLINDKLDLQVLISPIGGFEAFKRNCNTVCRGKGYLF